MYTARCPNTCTEYIARSIKSVRETYTLTGDISSGLRCIPLSVLPPVSSFSRDLILAGVGVEALLFNPESLIEENKGHVSNKDVVR